MRERRRGGRDQLRAVIPLRRQGDATQWRWTVQILRAALTSQGTLISAVKRAHTHMAGDVSGLHRNGSAETCYPFKMYQMEVRHL